MPRYTVAGTLGDMVNRFTAIEGIQDQIRTHIEAIDDLYSRITAVAGNGAQLARKLGRPPKAVAAVSGKGTRSPRGALKEAIRKVLAGGKTAGAADVMKKVLAAGFKTVSKPKVFYTTVYIAMKNDKAIEKTKDGFRLKATAKK